MIIITVGKSYIDIDGYASSIAYKKLLNMQGIETKFVSNATLNYSITDSLKKLPYTTDIAEVSTDDKFIILDLSNKDYFPGFVKESNIIEIIDHHPGFEEYWNNKLGDKSIIEPVGSVATIIVEKYEQLNLLDKIDKDLAKLLMSAILDNTLNFTAGITCDRDKDIYKKLEKILGEENYAEKYFNEVQNAIETNLEESIKNDIKIQYISKYIPDVFGQLTIWDFDKLLNKTNGLKSIMNTYGSRWILNLISLKNNISYIIYSDDDVKINLEQLLNCSGDNDKLIVKPAMLRKEIIKRAIEMK